MEIWNEIKNTNTKTLLKALIVLFLGGGAGAGIEFSFLENKVQEYAQPAIDSTVHNVVYAKVYSVLDSTLSAIDKNRPTRLEVEIADKMNVHRDSVANIIVRWYQREKGITFVGLFVEGGRVKYRDIDGHIYIPAYDQESQRFYFLHPGTNQNHWCL